MSEEIPIYGSEPTYIVEPPKSTPKVKIKKLHPDAVMPKRAHPTDAGYDLVAVSCTFDSDGNAVYGFGLAFEIPQGYAGFVFPRSSISNYDLCLSNCVGVIDSGYRGEVTAKFRPSMMFSNAVFPVTRNTRIYNKGERVAQLIILPIPEIEFTEADELSETDRGAGGYGSTGI